MEHSKLLVNSPDKALEVASIKSNATGALKRFALASVGIGCVGLAYVGAVLPGMPATIFLIMACYCFARSCPYLEQRLVRNRFFSRFHAYLDQPAQMPMRVRVYALLAMWVSATISAVVLGLSDGVAWWVPWFVIGLAVIGTLVILAIGRWHIAANKVADRALAHQEKK